METRDKHTICEVEKYIKWDQCSLDSIRENISEMDSTAIETIQHKT